MAKVRIPKRVAGVKIPKKVRRKAKKAVKLTESPAIREFAAAALGAAAQAQAGRASARTGSNGRGLTAGAGLTIDGDKLAHAIRTAALDGIRRFIEGFEEGLREATSGTDPDDREAGSARGGRRGASAPSADAGGE